jgi:hypothetical protein
MERRERVLRLLAVASGKVAVDACSAADLAALESALVPFVRGGGVPVLSAEAGAEKTTAAQLALAPEGAALAPAPVPVPKRPKAPTADDVRAVFVHWKEATGRERASLTRERLRPIRARLRDGLTKTDLCRAINVAAQDPFLSGDNDRGKRFDDITTIFKTTAYVEGLLEQGGHERDATPEEDALDAEQREMKMKVRRLREMYREALEEKDHEAAEKINRALARLLQAYRSQFQAEP